MKKALKSITLIFFIIFMPFLLYVVYEVFHLKLYMPNKPIVVDELTPEQKEEDFKKLTDLVSSVYPYASTVKTIKGLDDINTFAQDYIDRAKETSSNAMFLKLFIEYTERLRQAGHGGIVFLSNYDFYKSYTYDIGKDAFLKSQYWMQLSSTLNLYYHADVKMKYADGAYLTDEDFLVDDYFIPEGSVLEAINSLTVDEYVLTLQDTIPLRYDDKNHKPYTTQIFIKDPGLDAEGWDTHFKLADGSVQKVLIRKLPGYKDPFAPKLYPRDNILLLSLSEHVGYIKINSFDFKYIDSDNEKIQEYMKNNGKKLEKIILDLRGNTGGELTYWMDLLVRPLLQETVEYTQTTAIRKGFLKLFGIRLPMYRFIYGNDLLDRKTHHISGVNKTMLEGLDPNQWEAYEITKRLTPNNTFPFRGQVYVLADNDTVSAADSFVSAVRELKLGIVAGTNTYGWGNAFIAPVTFSMPNSGLMFQMDVECAYNTDEQITSIYGTKPDIELAPSEYPTPFPVKYEPEELLADEWIQWCISQ